MTGHTSAEQSANSLPLAWQRLLALSGVVFAVLFLVGWFASGGDAPDYGASDQAWTNWADDNQWKSRIGAFAMLLAGFVFLHFAATIRTALGDAETRMGSSVQLARVAFAGAITGIAGMVMAIVIISSATTEGADANPVVTRAIASSSAGPFLLSAMGFAALLLTAGLLTLRSGVFARWTGVVALIGAVGFLSRSQRFSRAWARTVCSASASSLASWRWWSGRSRRVSLGTALWERRQARRPTVGPTWCVVYGGLRVLSLPV